MPYIYKKIGNKTCVFKKNTKKLVGCTKGNIKKYLNALYVNESINEESADKIDYIKMDIPLFIRMLEFAREDAKTDLDLHYATEKSTKLTKEFGILSMVNYDDIVPNHNKTIKEETNLNVTDESPDSITVVATYNNRNAGLILLAKTEKSDTLEIIGIRFLKEYQTLFIINETIKQLFSTFKNVNHFKLSPKPDSIEFWNKLGFQRISKHYLVLNKGH